jgi:hypothetical protein
MNNFRHLYQNDTNSVTPITAALPSLNSIKKVILQNRTLNFKEPAA